MLRAHILSRVIVMWLVGIPMFIRHAGYFAGNNPMLVDLFFAGIEF